MRKKILWVAAALALIAIPAAIGLVALRDDDGSSSASRRAGAFVEREAVGGQLTIEGATREIMKPTEAVAVESWSWGVSNTGTAYTGGAGATTGKAQLGDLQVVKKVDKASPKLFQACATGTHYPKATLRLNRGGDKPSSGYLVITLEDVLITNVQLGGSGDDLPTEQVTLNYAKATISVEDAATGTPVAHFYDLRTAKAG